MGVPKMTKEMTKRQLRETKYLEIMLPVVYAADEDSEASLEQPTPLQIIEATTSSDSVPLESKVYA
jgi:hypothetical protein